MNSLNAATLYESATGPFNTTTCCGSFTNSSQFIGAIFSVNSQTNIDSIGGVFLNVSGFSGFGGSIFGAIVSLNGSNYPSNNGLALDYVIAYNVFTPTFGRALLSNGSGRLM